MDEPEAVAPRVNPFAFPSDTDLRFVLLVVATISVSLVAFHSLYFHITNAYGAAAAACRTSVDAAYTPGTLEWANALTGCLAFQNRLTGFFMVGGVLLVLLFGAALYWLLPAWKLRRDQLEPFTAEDDPELLAEVAELSQIAGLAAPPRVLTNADPSPSGLAFGRRGRYFLVLNAGLILQRAFDPPAFRAVVLHELAHVRGGDVDKTYFSLALGAAAVVAAILSYVVSLVTAPGDLLDTFNQILRTVVVLAVLFGPIRGLLRARELAADVRASGWEGQQGALPRLLEALEAPTGRWTAKLGLHPTPALRLRAVGEPQLLLRPGFWDALLTGLAASIAFPDLQFLLQLLVAGQDALFLYASVVGGLVFGGLGALVVGTGVWRGVLAEWVDPTAGLRLRQLALGLGLGLALGIPLSLTTYEMDPGLQSYQGVHLLVYLVWAAILIGCVRVFLGWVAQGARAWLSAGLHGRSPRMGYWAGVVLGGVLLGLLLTTLLLAQDLLTQGTSTMADLVTMASIVVLGGALVILIHPLTLLSGLSLWLYPAASAWFGRQARAAGAEVIGPRWLWLDPSERLPATAPAPGQVHWQRALLSGLRWGVAFCALAALVRLGLRLVLPSDVYDGDGFYTTLLAGQVVVAGLWQVVLGVRVAHGASRLGVLQGLAALSASGAIMLLGLVGLYVAFGPAFNFDVVPMLPGVLFNASALLAAPFMALATRFARPAGRVGTTA